MTTQGTDEIQLQLNVNGSARREFVEPEISDSVDILEATVFFQVVVGTDDMPVDITD